MSNISLSDFNVTIVGLGLIGGSFAKSIRQNLKFKNIWAVDINADVLNQSKDEGVIDDGFINPKFPLENSDIIILCTYPNATIDFLKDNMEYFKKNCIITDTIGIKNKIVTEIPGIIREDIVFIGGHPMSGKETAGYQFSDANIFKDSQYILTPEESTSEDAINILMEIIKGIGFKNITIMTPQMHDLSIAFTSQLPHIIACSLMNNNQLESSLGCIGGSFKDVTRVADINCQLWSELIHENKENILTQLDVFLKDINNIYDIIKNDDMEGLKLFFENSSLRRKEMIK